MDFSDNGKTMLSVIADIPIVKGFFGNTDNGKTMVSDA